MTPLFADVIVPIPLANQFTYEVPFDLADEVAVGKRVVVQFGKTKLYSGLILRLHEQAPTTHVAKPIQEVLDHEIIVTPTQFKHWQWISDYYQCSLGEVMMAAIPSGFQLSSETRLVANEESDFPLEELSDQEYLIAEALQQHNVLTLKEVSDILGKKTIHPIVKSLIERKVIFLYEEVQTKYKIKTKDWVELSDPKLKDAEKLQVVFDSLNKAPKQQHILMKYIELSQIFSQEVKPVEKQALLKASETNNSTLKQLVNKEILSIVTKESSRLVDFEIGEKEVHLTEEQSLAHVAIEKHFEDNKVTLLHGVTGSGKTEVYVKLIEAAIAKGQQVLFLLPEIALTTQIIERLKQFFGNDVGVYHSKFNHHERVEIWNGLLHHNRYKVVLGARSALFLPFTNLGLILVDEEHETSYKQFDPAPRYNARDSAIVLSQLHKANILLGSATPAVETYYNAKTDKFGLVELTKRYKDVPLPEIQVADLTVATKKKKMVGHFSPLLKNAIEEALENKEQVILFQNRRGFSPFVQCETCGTPPKCKRCDVSLTYHKYLHRLKCHYCGYEENMPKFCPSCGSPDIKLKGFGTEKIEEDIELIFPEAKVARMDLETTRSKNGYQKILQAFEQREVDILVGTQMVSKGLDFDNVSLVGIMNADQMLNFQDFRAHERSFQTMTQVAGRAGRKTKRGKVIIQTREPYHPIILNVIGNDYSAMFKQQILERRNFHYPPFFRIIKLTLKHKIRDVVIQSAQELSKDLRSFFGARILGPEFAPVPRINNQYLMQIYIKFERDKSTKQIKEVIQNKVVDLKQHPDFKSLRVIVDVDPQ